MNLLKPFILGIMLATVTLSAQAFQLDFGKIKSLVTRGKDMKEVDEKQEIEIGKGVAANLLGAAPLVPEARLQKYVNAVGSWLALHTERPDLEWHFGVLDSPDVNAFATPGGYIFITKGLLMRMRDEAELAGVLAHEIAHVLQKHHLKAIQKNAQVGILADVLGIAADQQRNAAILNKVISAGTEVYARGLDKEEEFEADRMGVVIAARAGYDPYGLPAVLLTLDGLNPQDSALALMFKTHPAPSARLEILDKIMSPGLDKYATQPHVASRFEKALGLASGKR